MEQKNTHHRHDKVFKQMYSDPGVFCALIESCLPKKLVDLINLETLERCNAAFIDKKGNQLQSDVLYKVETKDKTWIYLLVEHQSSFDREMILRFINYIHGTINQHKKQGHEYLPLVIPVLIYNGIQSPYPGSTEFSAAFNNKKHIKGFLVKEFLLIDLTVMNDEVLMGDIWTACPNMLLKYLREDDFLPILKKLQPILLALKKLGGEQSVEIMLECIISFASMPDDEALLETLQKMSTEVEINMQTVKERWEEQAALKARAEGIAEGIIQGEMKGIAEGIIQGEMKGIAKGEMKGIAGIVGNMIEGGFGIKQISQVTKLPLELIQKLSLVTVN